MDVAGAYARALAIDVWPEVDFAGAPTLFGVGSDGAASRLALPPTFGAPGGLPAAGEPTSGVMSLDDGLRGTPADLGVVYERALALQHRHEQGIYYTPIGMASQLADLALNHHVAWSGRALGQEPPTI